MDPTQIDQILANLCVNARDAIADKGKVTIRTENVVFGDDYCSTRAGLMPGEYVLLSVSDNGCGMDQETLGNLFEPFFTTKGAGKGTGLGLATVYGIVKQNNGYIGVHSEPGRGTVFRIHLPRHMPAGQEVRKEKTTEPVLRGHETILLVEDEEAILNMAKTMLQRLGYGVLASATPRDAVQAAEKHSGELHLLITDVVMPEMNGRELADRLQLLYPNLKILFTSGYTADVIAHHGVLDVGTKFIQKPFTFKGLAASVREVLSTQTISSTPLPTESDNLDG